MFQQFNAVNSFRVFYEIMFRNMEERRRNKHCIEVAKKIYETLLKNISRISNLLLQSRNTQLNNSGILAHAYTPPSYSPSSPHFV